MNNRTAEAMRQPQVAQSPAQGFVERRRRQRDALDEAVVGFPVIVPSEDGNTTFDKLKRILDVTFSAIGLLALLPLFTMVGAAVKLTSPGPIFFAQSRVGRGGRVFKMYKFRSMVSNAEQLKLTLLKNNEQTGPVFKMKHDPRMTPVGRFIRKFSIDELPQLFNVLTGEMSLVGPRPPVPEEVARYRAWQTRRLSITPGLTCIWQVSGRNRIGFEDWMRLDIQYIENRSLGLDLRLLAKTVKVVVTADGAS